MTPVPPPTWVRQRDDSLVPFDADRIHRALFSAGERLGRSDPFLARELTDGVLHFLTLDSDGQTITTQRIREVVAQVVRELGHPELARAYTERPTGVQEEAAVPRPLAAVLAATAREYTLRSVYTRDLAAAQEAGLLTLTGLETPAELAGCVLGPPVVVSGNLVADLEEVRRFAGQVVAVDGLEYLAERGQSPAAIVTDLARGVRLNGLSGVVNLNCARPPSWAGPLTEGPLFASCQPGATVGCDPAILDELLARLLEHSAHALLRIDWHLSADDFTPERRVRLHQLARRAIEDAPIAFTFDRPRRPILLAAGLDREHPATLLVAGLHLPTLAVQSGMHADPERFLVRLGSLVRLALSAAVQKRDFVRQEVRRMTIADVTSGFLLDRARFVVVPVGLDEVVHQFTGWGMANGGTSLDLARWIVRRIGDVLRQDGRQAQMDSCVEGPCTFALEGDNPTSRDRVAGVTAWDATATPRSQLRGGMEQGTAAVFIGDATPEEVGLVLEQAWRETPVARIRFLRGKPDQRSLFGG